MSDGLCYRSGTPCFFCFVIVAEITVVILSVQFGIGSRNTVHHDTGDICPGIPGVTPFDDVISLRRNSGRQT